MGGREQLRSGKLLTKGNSVKYSFNSDRGGASNSGTVTVAIHPNLSEFEDAGVAANAIIDGGILPDEIKIHLEVDGDDEVEVNFYFREFMGSESVLVEFSNYGCNSEKYHTSLDFVMEVAGAATKAFNEAVKKVIEHKILSAITSNINKSVKI